MKEECDEGQSQAPPICARKLQIFSTFSLKDTINSSIGFTEF